MEEILERYKGNWDQIVEEFEQVRSGLEAGRNEDNIESGLSDQESPFFDLIIMEAYNNEISEAQKELLKPLVIKIVALLKETVDKPSFLAKTRCSNKKIIRRNR